MKTTSFTHWIGVFFLFAAAILLLITTISAPVVTDIGILHVQLTNKTNIRHSSVNFGSFGYCVLDVPPITTDQDWCAHKHIGYKPAAIMAEIDHTSFTEIGKGTSDGLTKAMILHPIACALAFIAFFVSLGAGIIGSLMGTIVALIAFLLTLVVMVVDFVLFGIIKNHVNRDGSGSHARYSYGMWTILAAFILLFFGMIIVFFTCCSARREKKSKTTSKYEPRYEHGHMNETRHNNGLVNETNGPVNETTTYESGPREPLGRKRFGRF